MDHKQQSRAIGKVSRTDGSMVKLFTPQNLKLVETEEPLFPLGTSEVANIGTVLVLGKSPNGNSPVDLNQRFGCAVLLREGTPEEVAREWSPNQKPKYVERLRFDSIFRCFVRTGISEGYAPFF
jgi:hypothetical protein